MPERRALTRAGEILARRRGSTDRLIGGRRCHHARPLLLLQALQETFARHYLGVPQFAENCSLHPAELRRLDQLSLLPPTEGELQDFEQARLRRIVHTIFAELGMTSPRRCHYLLLDGPSELASLTRVHRLDFTPELVPSRRPMRLLGSPQSVARLVAGQRVRLHPHSWVLAGPQPTPDSDFRAATAEALGIPPEQVRTFYAPTPGAVPVASCEHGQLHLSRLVHVIEGEKLQFFTPYAGAALSLSAPQSGRLRQGCPCGRPSAVLELCQARQESSSPDLNRDLQSVN